MEDCPDARRRRLEDGEPEDEQLEAVSPAVDMELWAFVIGDIRHAILKAMDQGYRVSSVILPVGFILDFQEDLPECSCRLSLAVDGIRYPVDWCMSKDLKYGIVTAREMEYPRANPV